MATPRFTTWCSRPSRRGQAMALPKRSVAAGVAAVAVAAGLSALVSGTAVATERLNWTSIAANGVVRGVAIPNSLSPQLREQIATQGSQQLENPTSLVKYYGYLNDGTQVPDPAAG